MVPTMLLVSHSRSGSTRAIVDALAAGAADDAIDGVVVRDLDALEATVEDVCAADLVVLATPENFGYMSGALKYFLDAVYHPLLDGGVRRPYQLVVKAGNDGSGAVRAVERIVRGLSWPAARPPLIVVGDVTDADREIAAELGMALAASLEMGLL